MGKNDLTTIQVYDRDNEQFTTMLRMTGTEAKKDLFKAVLKVIREHSDFWGFILDEFPDTAFNLSQKEETQLRHKDRIELSENQVLLLIPKTEENKK